MATTGNFRYKLTSGENKIEKPTSFARDNSHEENGADVKKTLALKGIKQCYNPECKADVELMVYDRSKDEIYCSVCGYVLRQNFHDYEDLFLDDG